MFNAPANPEPNDPAPEAQAERVAALRELREIGMDLARALRVQALAGLEAARDPEAQPPPQVTPGDPVLMFTRVARAVRMTVALEMRLGEPGQDQAAERWRTEALQARRRRRAQVFAIAREIVDADGASVNRNRNLNALDARFDTEGEDEAEADFAQLPMGVLVARICRELGVRPDWSPWAGTDWAHEEARAQAPGSPFAGPHAQPLRPLGDGLRPRPAPPRRGPP